MDLQKKCTKLTQKIEKIVTTLTDGTAITQQQRAAKEQQIKDLEADLLALTNLLPGQGVKKVKVFNEMLKLVV